MCMYVQMYVCFLCVCAFVLIRLAGNHRSLPDGACAEFGHDLWHFCGLNHGVDLRPLFESSAMSSSMSRVCGLVSLSTLSFVSRN